MKFPPVSIIIVPVILGLTVGGIIGTLFSIVTFPGEVTLRYRFTGLGVTVGFLFSALVWAPNVAKQLLHPDEFYHRYKSKIDFVDTGPQVFVVELWRTETECDWLECGLTAEQWRTVAESVHATKKFTVDTVGRAEYAQIAEILAVNGLLMKAGKGFVLTNPLGVNFFRRMATSPYPYKVKPDSFKMMGKPVHTHTTHTELE